MQKNEIRVAIDGPAAAGKSTVSKMVAKELSFIYIDTGAMYRALTYKALNKQVSLEDEDKLADVLADTSIELIQGKEQQHVLVDGEDVTHDIRTEKVTNNVSHAAKHPEVRLEMVKRQQELARKRGVVMDGRDIGTHVIPDAELKIFLKASVEERAKRRYEEMLQKGFSVDIEKIKQEIEQRDQIDSKREAAPLIKADDAIELDTTNLSIDEVKEAILKAAAKVLPDKGEKS
ncbi:cytidylate kinase [Lentibacillus amyloliquefaciens]|uniref:Cytidylate kinase n=2 Tax=Lentibacillus amyloliquefaciens TaxID=1472767 RepID=A0A0U4FJ04_9BACI|nr:cytidylate kinase [Lentibacillus amyloliquefaciens]